MVNATEMAKIFGKLPAGFLRNETTKQFIEACLNYANSHNLNVEKEEDIVVFKQNSGTWMHRVLALKFAAWLSPEFELWVYSTIEGLLFADYRDLKKTFRELANVQDERDRLKAELREENPKFKRLEELQTRERQILRSRTRYSQNQTRIFREGEMDAMARTDEN